jgi:hypothetical protein
LLATRWRHTHPLDALAVVLALLVGGVVFFVATDLFPYHSVNDDEGVYLLQAAMLLEGQLFLSPGPAIVDLVHPWFFIEEPTPTGALMYPKYAPVPAAMFAVGMLLGEPRFTLGAVAAGSAWLLYLLGRDLADRSTGLVAVCLLATAPMFLLSSSVFLPYAATTFWNLSFAVAYLRAVDRHSLRYAAAAGVAIGVAFFARPYTAVLFAAPFIAHTCWRLWRGHRSGDLRPPLELAVAIALPGLCFVGLTLAYNAVMTGSATTFPYQAFAPRDGLGFGEREILGYTETFTPALGYEATREALTLFFTQFAPLGVVGCLLALGGASVALEGGDAETDVDRGRSLLLLGVAVSVVLGNGYFWGTLNGLRNGLIDLLGPFYHFDLLVPVSLFAAVGSVTLARRLYALVDARLSTPFARVALALLLVCAAPVAVSAERGALSDPWDANRDRTESLAATYEPFTEQEFEDALVYTPDPYGDWQQHPFQYLRNDPGFDGPALYVLDEGPDSDVRALDATDRTPYRFTYRGEWSGAVAPVEPELTRLRVLDGERVSAVSRFGAPDGATAASIRIETEDDAARYRVESADAGVRVDWELTPEGVSVTNHPQAAGPAAVPLPPEASEVDVVVRFVTVGGASVTYRQEATVSVDEAGIRVLWPPETRVCRLRPECGTEGTWVGPDGDYLSGVSVETDARVVSGDR